MDAGLISKGFVDERSIVDVKPGDLGGYDQCHFFAGIAGWSLALQLAGWGDRPVWTGSCPCQPFSCAGKRQGAADKRHLWPEFYRLIRECHPRTLFGEQVGGTLGKQWLAGVYADLEMAGYVVPKDDRGNYLAYDLCAASVGAPHIRQRLWWVAHAECHRSGPRWPTGKGQQGRDSSIGTGGNGGLGVSDRSRPRPRQSAGEAVGYGGATVSAGGNGGLADPAAPGQQGHRPELSRRGVEQQPAESGFWSDFVLIPCRDGKARRTQSGVCCLADRSAFELDSGSTLAGKSRVGMLKAFGNCIVPPLASEFIKAYMETIRNGESDESSPQAAQ